jgi:hypothetical protein
MEARIESVKDCGDVRCHGEHRVIKLQIPQPRFSSFRIPGDWED